MSKMLMRSNIGDHVWLITSRQTLPELESTRHGKDKGSESLRLVDVGVEDPVYKAYRRGLVRVLLWQNDANSPHALSKI